MPIGAAYNAPDLTLEASTLVTASSESLASVEDSFSVPVSKSVPAMVAAIDELVVELLSHKQLATDQSKCPDVLNHRRGHMPKTVKMANVSFSPAVQLYCEVSGQKARPLVPLQWRNQIIKLYHQLTHYGQKDTVKKCQIATTGQD